MYKRINKRIKKKEKEEALGIDEEVKEVLGTPETDSDESDSSDEESDGSSGESNARGETTSAGTRKRRGTRQFSASGESDAESRSGDEVEDEGEDEDEEMVGEVVDEDEPPMTIPEALKNPLYLVQKSSEVQGCILCPGKELKHAKMASIHLESSSHLRRMKRFAALAARVGDEEEDPRLLVAALDESVRIAPREKSIKIPHGPKVSKKERRFAKRERRRERRAVQQAENQTQEERASETRPVAHDRVLQSTVALTNGCT